MKTTVPVRFFPVVSGEVKVLDIKDIGWDGLTNFIEGRLQLGYRPPFKPRKHHEHGITIVDRNGKLIMIGISGWVRSGVLAKHFNQVTLDEVETSLSRQTARTP
ncbi:MAG: hypothetical protein WCG07_02550 [Candidatus Taylorbacteria bacterium]